MIQLTSQISCIKGADESMTRVGLSVPLMYHDLSDLGLLILFQITSKERILYLHLKNTGSPIRLSR